MIVLTRRALRVTSGSSIVGRYIDSIAQLGPHFGSPLRGIAHLNEETSK